MSDSVPIPFLPIIGGTLLGALVGTTATFTGTVTLGSTGQISIATTGLTSGSNPQAAIVLSRTKLQDSDYGIDIFPVKAIASYLRVTTESLIAGSGNGVTFQAQPADSTGGVNFEGRATGTGNTSVISQTHLLFGAGGRTERARLTSAGNWLFGLTTDDTVGKLQVAGIVTLKNTTAPAGTPSGGGYLWVESGALKYKGSSGTVTTLGAA